MLGRVSVHAASGLDQTRWRHFMGSPVSLVTSADCEIDGAASVCALEHIVYWLYPACDHFKPSVQAVTGGCRRILRWERHRHIDAYLVLQATA